MGIDIVILAGGGNSRMQTDSPKFFLKLADKPIVRYIIDNYKSLPNTKIHVVTARRYTEHPLFSDINVIEQPIPNGTAGAVMVALPFLTMENVVIHHSDVPLVSLDTIVRLLNCNADAVVTIGSIPSDKLSTPYGRVFFDKNCNFESIVEYKELSSEQKLCNKFNVGLYKFNTPLLRSFLGNVKRHTGANELYLPDVLRIFREKKHIVKVLDVESYDECIGINNMPELIQAERIIQKRIINNFIQSGVQILSPATTYISTGVVIGRNVVIEPNVVIKGKSKICDNVTIRSFSYIDGGVVQ